MSETGDRGAQSGIPEKQLILEQYKAYMTDVGNIGTRYTAANAFYLSIISGLLAVFALAKKGEAFEKFDFLLYIAVPIFALLLCCVWYATQGVYSATFKLKFDVLRAIESQLPFPIFKKEEELRKEAIKKGEGGRRLVVTERWIPVILGVPFVILLAYGIWLIASR